MVNKTQHSLLRTGLSLVIVGGWARTAQAGFADAIVAYEPGTGYATDWATGEGYLNETAALGMPSRVTVDPDPQYGGAFPIDPFGAPYLRSQIVSLGEGGELTVRLATPAINDPAHPYGIDFQIYGSAAFVIVNGDFTGGGVTDGSLFGATLGETRVAVSEDGTTFYELNPSLAPVVDALFPTDGMGDFGLAVDPSLAAADFDGQDLAGIRALYTGSAGGAGYDLAWALDREGNPVGIDAARFVRVSVLSGHAEIDGFATVPEASTGALFLLGLAGLLTGRRARRIGQGSENNPRNPADDTHHTAGHRA